MRYKEGEAPDLLYSHTSGMHAMLTLSVVTSLIIGCVLLYLGVHGKVMWLKYWSIGLILCSITYLVTDFLGVF